MATEDRLPVMEDFSTAAIKKHVSEKIWHNPITWFSVVIGLGVGGIGWAATEMLIWMTVGGLGVGVGALSFLADITVRKNSYESNYVLDYNKRIEEYAGKKAEYLIAQFKDMELSDPRSLVERFGTFLENYKLVVDNTFEQGGMVHDQYLSIGQSLYADALDKLTMVHSKYISLRGIDFERNERRLAELNGESDQAAESERQSIMARQEQRINGQNEINTLLAEIQERLTSMSTLTDKVASVPRGQGKEALGGIMADAQRMIATTSNLQSEL